MAIAPAATAGAASRSIAACAGDHAQEHPDDRPHGRGQDRDSRRLARLADAPFIKVEATKFTEVGYVGKDVDSIIRDLVEAAVKQTRERSAEEGARARRRRRRGAHPRRADPRRARAKPAPTARRARCSASAARGQLDDKEIEIDLADARPQWASNHGPRPGMEEMTEQLRGMFSQMGQGGARRAS